MAKDLGVIIPSRLPDLFRNSLASIRSAAMSIEIVSHSFPRPMVQFSIEFERCSILILLISKTSEVDHSLLLGLDVLYDCGVFLTTPFALLETHDSLFHAPTTYLYSLGFRNLRLSTQPQCFTRLSTALF